MTRAEPRARSVAAPRYGHRSAPSSPRRRESHNTQNARRGFPARGGTCVADYSPCMTRRVRIIVTPGSGEGRAAATARRLRNILAQRGDHTSLGTYTTLAALERWARTCDEDFTHLVCIGGDATQSAAARASMRLSVPFI